MGTISKLIAISCLIFWTAIAVAATQEPATTGSATGTLEPIPADDPCPLSPTPYEVTIIPRPPFVILTVIPLPEGFDCVPTLPPGSSYYDEHLKILWIQQL